MRLVLVTPPAPLIAWPVVDSFLRLGGDESQRPLVEALLAAATRSAEQATGRAFAAQKWCYFPSWRAATGHGCFVSEITLPLRPVISVDEITYTPLGVEDAVTWAPTEYLVIGLGASGGVRVRPSSDTYWPNIGTNPEGLQIAFTAGYEDPLHPDLASARAAILLILGDLFANREAQVIAPAVARVENTTAANLLAPLCVWS